ncbi:hypothetical protein HUX88_16665 [Duganella sp. BJB1802]|uniref:hypothetical protein n=1 Tax=Duganella sp. BJB1802 TaxID=2744575 RepID=UPI001593ABA0|nr:hypothetical protein [Duganella sp. BJB1802]NVD72171.1 hypothetical protein [Duganella sp. BJB1802]
MPPTVYLDTSVILHLADPPSPNPIIRACQQLTQLWWDTRCDATNTYVSEYVIAEIRHGDPLSMARRLRKIEFLPRLPDGGRTEGIAELLICGGGLNARAMKSAEHIACAAQNRSEILLTWNCRDIANAGQFRLLRILINAQRLHLPELVTPFELMENRYENI